MRVPFRIATGQHSALENVLFRVWLTDGTIGYGEGGVATHISGETVDGTLARLRAGARALAGTDLSDYRGVCARFADLFDANPAAQAAFELAVLDAVARSCGFPFWRYFGTRPVSCRTDITVVLGSLREAGAMTRQFVRRGFRVFKIKIGGDEAIDLARVRAVAQQAPGAALLLDGNQAYDAARMLQFLAVLRRWDIRPRLIEQPVPRDDWDGLAKLTRDTSIPVCADESVRTLAEAVYAVKSKAVRAINVKFAKSGVFAALEIAQFARASGMRLMIGAMMESALSITAAGHCAAGFGAFDYVDLDTTFFINGAMGESPYLDAQGRFTFAGAGPGIGVTLTPAGGRRSGQRGTAIGPAAAREESR